MRLFSTSSVFLYCNTVETSVGLIVAVYFKNTLMIKRITPFVKSLGLSGIVQYSRVFITPFKEKPACNTFGNTDMDEQPAEHSNAVNLFSIFTADIIKQDVVFTR
jgi:hypothetical protein